MKACNLCGGTAIDPRLDAHHLCVALKKLGLPTPSLGDQCPTCKGSGVKPGFNGGVMLPFSLGPAAIKRSIDAQFPLCPDCDNGVVKNV